MQEWSQNSVDRADIAWTTLVEMYAGRLTRDYGESVPNAWRRAINGMRDYEVERGLRRLLMDGSQSPPTLPAFVKACRQPGEAGESSLTTPSLPGPSYDDFHRYGQKALLSFLMHAETPPPEPVMAALISAKNKLVNDFREMDAECEVVTAQMREAFQRSFDRVAKQMAA